MQNIQLDVITILPEIIVFTMAMVVLLTDLFLKPSNRMMIYLLSQFTLLAAIVAIIKTHTPTIGYVFTGLFVDDTLSDTIKVMILSSTFIYFVYTRSYLEVRKLFCGEFYALCLFGLLGMMIMVSGSHFLTLYIGLELLSLSLYALVALDRDNARATEAAMKYFVLGALASGMLLYGISMIYGATGSLNLAQVASQILNVDLHKPVLVLGLVFVVSGLAFKLGAVPFQMWVPDVYEGAPTAMTLFIASVSKLAAFVFVIRFLAQGLSALSHDWAGMLLMMAVLSMAIGNVTAIAQTNLKRMLAYSTISHVGFLLYGIMSASINGYASALFYITAYVLMTLAGFGMMLLLSRKGFEAEQISDLKGLSQRSPWFAFMMMITMFSMAGVPMTVGFFAKFTVLQAALQAGYTGMVVFAVLMAAIGAYYYLRVVWYMYFEKPEDASAITAPMDMKLILSLNALLLLALGLFPQPLMNIAGRAMQLSIQ